MAGRVEALPLLVQPRRVELRVQNPFLVVERAREVFDRAAATANDVGLFSEEYDAKRDELLGNFPQALTHLSHIAAAVALSRPAQR